MDLSRRSLLEFGVTNIVLLPFAAPVRGHAFSRIPRIEFLISKIFPAFTADFLDELRRLGYQNGRTILIEIAETPQPANSNFDLVVAASLGSALELRGVMPVTPMVVVTAPGFVSNGLARSLEHPGGNVTGMDELPPGITGRRLALLKEAAPALSRVALLSTTPGTGGFETQLADARKKAAEVGVDVKPYRASNPAELESALAAIRADKMQGLLNFQGGLSLVYRQMIVDFAAKQRMPAIYQSMLFAESGGLMAYAPDQDQQFRMAARYVDRILRGAKPGDLPIQYPSRYYLTINMRAVRELNLKISKALLAKVKRFVG